MLGYGFGLRPFARGGAGAGSGPETDPGVTGILADGWRVTHADPASLGSEPRYLVVKRPGFSGDAAPVTVTEALRLTARVRLPWPDHALDHASEVALSDFVHAGDSAPGLTNGSTLSWPRPQAMWLNADLARVEASFTARLLVSHAYARSGRPVAAVRFTASDGLTTLEQTVSTLTVASYDASGLSVPHFAGTFDLSALTAGPVTVDATIYPWIGTAFTLSTDADPWPSVNLTTLKVLCDHDGSWGTAIAHVAAAGSDATGVAAEADATAAAQPFATIQAAAAAIRDYSLSNFGRNDAGGGVIRLAPGTHAPGKFQTIPTLEFPLTVEAADPAQKASTILTDDGGTSGQLDRTPAKTHWRNLTIRPSSSNNVCLFDAKATNLSAFIFTLENVDCDGGGMAPWGAWIYRMGRCTFINCSDNMAKGLNPFSHGDAWVAKVVGCRASGPARIAEKNAFFIAGTRQETVVEIGPGTVNRPTPVGPLVAFNHISASDAANPVFQAAGFDSGPAGLGLVGNVFESHGGASQPALSLWADGDQQTVENIVVHANTIVGERLNFLYDSTGSTASPKRGTLRFTVATEYNSKDDTMAPQSGARTGNWSVEHHVGYCGNAFLRGDSAGSAGPGRGNVWLGELLTDDEVAGTQSQPLTTEWAADRSNDGDGSGGGDYAPGATAALPTIPPGLAPVGFDQKGRPVPDDGTALAGALQRP